ncbi:MAG: 30S ribosomal protein S24e [Methanosarcinales archaeon]|nr:30S ribosomal protein S24e [Methanosarcinales archaeon]MCK4651671.1 30S ribosomal protein S24e [Methanosarcinales archaeon]MCK4811694.1 30S ribosomal protein S24e [Methanosarcinales archaeon]
MKIEIIKDEKNVLLNRRDIAFNIIPEGTTASRENVKNMLVALLDTKPELTVLDRMKMRYGTQDILGYARLYDDLQQLQVIEPDYMIARNAAKESGEE